MISSRKRVEDAAHTSSTHDGDDEPIKMYVSEGFDITEAVPERCKDVMADEYCLNKFDNVDAIDEIFCEFSVLRKC